MHSNSNKVFREHDPQNTLDFTAEFINLPKSKVIDAIFQEIDNVKKFMLKNYG